MDCEIVSLREEHLEGARELLVASFLSKNDVWSSFNVTPLDLHQFFGQVLQQHLENERKIRTTRNKDGALNLIIIEKGKVIGVLINYEIDQYLKKQSSVTEEKLELFQKLQQFGKELVRGLDLSQYQLGQTAYINFGSIHPDYNPPYLHKLVLFIQMHQRLKQSGYRWVISRSSNQKAVAPYLTCGGRVLREVEFSHQGKKFKLYYIEIDLHSAAFLQMEAGLSNLIESINETSRAKL